MTLIPGFPNMAHGRRINWEGWVVVSVGFIFLTFGLPAQNNSESAVVVGLVA